MDKFPEAFRRFEREVYIENIESFHQLRLVFSFWAGSNWRDTPLQIIALKGEAYKRGIPVLEPVRFMAKPVPKVKTRSWKHELVSVRGKLQSRYRDLKTGRFIRKPSR